MKKVSVCMATYNGEKFLYNQIESILNQLNYDDELIISDDYSTDNTVNIINSFNDSRITVLKNDVLRSVTHNFENALSAAKGDAIFLSDQDDVWYSEKISKMLYQLENYDLIVSNCDFIDENGNKLGKSFFDDFNSGSGLIKNFIKNTFLGNCIAFNRSVLDVILPFPDELHTASQYLLFHDVWIGLVANLKFKVQFTSEKLSGFRRHGGNTSPTEMSRRSPQTMRNKILGRTLLALALIKRFVRNF